MSCNHRRLWPARSAPRAVDRIGCGQHCGLRIEGQIQRIGWAIGNQRADILEQDIGALIANGPADALNLTFNTQPAMLTAAYAVYRAWRAAGGPEPAMVAGHSLGEYTALVAAGALAFDDALKLVRFRAQIMQEAVPEGAGS